MRLSILTATCDRPEAFGLCLGYVARQTVKPHEHIVIDDSVTPVLPAGTPNYYHKPEFRGKGSMVKKVRWALENGIITGDALVFVEDDDFYSTDYLAHCEKQLARYDLIGEGRNLYYNVAYRWWFDHGNLEHASLCATALTAKVFPLLLKTCIDSERLPEKDRPFIDSQLWKNFRGRKHVFDPQRTGRRMTIGIKAMPGLQGYGSGHDKDSGWAIRDHKMTKLKGLLGADAAHYEKFYQGPAQVVIPQPTGMPSVEVHIVAYNEEMIMPYALRHYKTFASRIVVHDGGSTDRTREICAEEKVEVVHWETEGKINDELLRILKETCWNGTEAEWVLVVDADELVYFPQGAEKTLRAYDAIRIPVAKARGFEMESATLPTTAGQIYEEIDHGAPDDRWYGKPCLLRPSLIQSIHFTHGAHECLVTMKSGRRIPNPRVFHQPPMLLLHYKHLGPVERLAAVYDSHKSRFSAINLKNGWGWQQAGIINAQRKRTAIMAARRKVV